MPVNYQAGQYGRGIPRVCYTLRCDAQPSLSNTKKSRAFQRAFAFGAIRQLVPPLALFERPLIISGRTLHDTAANHTLTGKGGRPSIEGWQFCCDGKVLFDVCWNSLYFLLRLLDIDPVCIVIELTSQMYQVKDIDSFVEATVECFSIRHHGDIS